MVHDAARLDLEIPPLGPIELESRLTAIDLDPIFIDDARSRRHADWPIDLAVHDMLAGPFGGDFDAACSVNAVVVCKAGQSAAVAELQQWVKERLRSSRTPERIEFREELPYNETGKLLRRKVRAELMQG